MRILTSVVALAATLGGAASVSAQSYPSRPITVVVGFTAGGPTDVSARILTERMRTSLGQPVLVENVTGANGTIGVGRVARAPADGYTLSFGGWTEYVASGAIYPLAYDLLKDFTPISPIRSGPYLIVAKNGIPANDLTGLIAWLKTNKASAGTGGVGGPEHLGGLLFQSATGTRFQFVPYRGSGPAIQDLAAGHIDILFQSLITSLPAARAGLVKAYAVMAKTRVAAAPDIPTVDEAGAPGLYLSSWSGLWAPRNTPKDIVARLNAAVGDTLADPAVRSRLTDLGSEIPPRDQQTPEALAALQKAEVEKWWPIIKAANIKEE
jgi:tripartite-type tricarboxylate transporter receptor subunit TctC